MMPCAVCCAPLKVRRRRCVNPTIRWRRFCRPATARRIREGADKEKISAALKWVEADGNRIITLADGDYPRTLLELSSPPTLLYAKGDSRLINNLSVAVVGSRSASIAGGAQHRNSGARAFGQRSDHRQRTRRRHRRRGASGRTRGRVVNNCNSGNRG